MQAPVVAWAQDMLRLYLKIETKPQSNVGKAEFQQLVVEIREHDLLCRYVSGGVHYELAQKFLRPIDPEQSRYAVTGRKLTFELRKVKPSGWKRPFRLDSKATPKWLKTDFDRWDEDVQAVDSGDEKEETAAPVATAKADDLRSALREVEEREKRERQERQKQLEESMKVTCVSFFVHLFNRFFGCFRRRASSPLLPKWSEMWTWTESIKRKSTHRPFHSSVFLSQNWNGPVVSGRLAH